jgi:penicillin-binding protein 1A
VDGIGGQARREFARYLGRREVSCEPTDARDVYRCRVDDRDLSRVVLFNGGGRAAADATPELKAAEQRARSARVGIWGANGDERDND